MVTNVFEFGS